MWFAVGGCWLRNIVAFDDLEQTKQAIDAGIIAATMVQRPFTMGVLSIQYAYDILSGGADLRQH